MRLLILATVGGGLGAALRYLVQRSMIAWLGVGFPWWTLCINVAGSFAMGVVAAMIALRFDNSIAIRTFLVTGILGGFTTFSAFSLDAATLLDARQSMAASGYIVGSVVLSILALYAGLAMAKAIWS